MMFETQTATVFENSDSVFDFSRPAPAQSENEARLIADRADPELGWAARNPARAMLFLFVTPRDGQLVDELLAL
jgi:hypothetical protein